MIHAPSGLRTPSGLRALVKRWLRRLRDRKTRRRLLACAQSEAPVAVAASTWDWPNPTHGFVYQDMLGLLAAGFDLQILYGEPRQTDGMAVRFRPLLARCSPVETLHDLHLADRDALHRDHPGRVEAFLQRVAAATGRPLAELRDDPTVLRACTFTRLVELSSARYLHSWFFYDMSFLAMFAAAVLDIPRTISCYVDHRLDDHPFKLVRLQIETADLVLATSQRTRDELIAIAGPAAAAKIAVQHIGVDGTAFRPLRAHRATTDVFELVSVCRLEPKKGLEFLVDACAQLLRSGRRVRARILGGVDAGHAASADYAAALQHRIHAHGLAADVLLAGPARQDDVPLALARADAFVAPYVELESGDADGIPTAVLEAMGAGLPIVCTDAGAMREALTPDTEACFVPQRDAVALARAIGRLIDDATTRRRLGEAAAKRFDREFDAAVTSRLLQQRVHAMHAGSRR